MSYGYYAIPRSLHATIRGKYRPAIGSNMLLVLGELGFRVRYNGNIGGGLEIGQCFCGNRDLALRTGLSEDQVRTALKHLEEIQTISRRSTSSGQTITIREERLYRAASKEVSQEEPGEIPTNIPIPIPIQENNTNTGGISLFKLPKQDGERLCLAYNASQQEFEVEYRAMEEWLQDPKKNKSGRAMSFRFASNWMKRWEAKPKKDKRLEELKEKLFAPAPHAHWE